MLKFILKILSYPRSILATLFAVVWTVMLSIASIVWSFLSDNWKRIDVIMNTWSAGILWAFGVKLEVLGRENLPEGGAIVLFNHTSLFDIPVLTRSLPVHLRYGAKIELFSVPFFGRAMRSFGMLEIVRHQREQVLKLYEKSVGNVKAGVSYALAPEGTRQPGGAIGAFKSGPFYFALTGGLNLVPVVLIGVDQILPKKHWFGNWGVWQRTIRVRILPVVNASQWTMDTRTELQEHVRNMMVKAYEQG